MRTTIAFRAGRRMPRGEREQEGSAQAQEAGARLSEPYLETEPCFPIQRNDQQQGGVAKLSVGYQ